MCCSISRIMPRTTSHARLSLSLSTSAKTKMLSRSLRNLPHPSTQSMSTNPYRWLSVVAPLVPLKMKTNRWKWGQVLKLPHKKVSIIIIINLNYLDIDWKTFEEECKNIVNEISNRFIDLGLEDHETDYGADQLQVKQERFKQEFTRLPFVFDAPSLQIPVSASNFDELLEEEDEHISHQNAQLGNNISEILHIMQDKMREDLKFEGELVMRN